MKWELKKLGEVCEFQGGSQPPKSTFSYTYKEGYIRLIQIRDYKSDKHIVYVPKEKARRFCQPDDVMIGRYGPPLFQILRGLEGAYNVALIKAIPKEEILSKDFLYLFLQTPEIQNYIINLSARAAGQTGVNKKALNPYPIPVPPIAEQRTIVEILDEAFKGIDRAEANTKKNLTNARELFKSYLNKVFSQDYKHWEKEKLKNLSSKIGSGATPRGGQKSYKTEGISLIRSLNIHDRKFKKKNLAFIDEEQSQKLSNVIVENGDVLLNITGASIARCCVVPNHYLPARVNQHVSIIRPNKSRVLPRFLNYLITSKNYKDKLLLTGEKAGSTRQALTKTQIQNFVIQYPNIETQSKIIDRLDKFEKETTRLEIIYQRKLEALAELKQSILQKAFTGKLT